MPSCELRCWRYNFSAVSDGGRTSLARLNVVTGIQVYTKALSWIALVVAWCDPVAGCLVKSLDCTVFRMCWA